MMDFLEKVLWTFGLIGVLCLPLFSFIGQKSYIRDEDIQVQEAQSAQKQEEALNSILKYLKGKEKERFLQQIKLRKQMAKKSASVKSEASKSRFPSRVNNNVIREANSYDYLPPNTQVKFVSSDFKMKYASSFQEVMNVAKQAGSRFVRTPEGSRPQIIWINPGTIIHKLGFRPGDVLMRVNGRPVSSIRDGQNLYNALKNDREFLVEVYRQGAVHRFVYKMGE